MKNINAVGPRWSSLANYNDLMKTCSGTVFEERHRDHVARRGNQTLEGAAQDRAGVKDRSGQGDGDRGQLGLRSAAV